MSKCSRLVLSGLSKDMSGRRLSPAEDTLRLILDTTPALIDTGWPDGYLDYFNCSWREYTGKSLEELCGWCWTDYVYPEDVAGIIQKWQASLGSGEPFEAEPRIRRGDGSHRAVLHRKAPLRDEHGTIYSGTVPMKNEALV